ncbi:hypothetical protein PG994_012574 [Apiospora phragmitis]|uniref:Uncharacterized protein n=1 Tax=Apiospora phragmitis TaxID=2905665 RepID=A0ABR1TAW8_9PEZI
MAKAVGKNWAQSVQTTIGFADSVSTSFSTSRPKNTCFSYDPAKSWEQWARVDGKFTCTNYIATGQSQDPKENPSTGSVTAGPEYQAFKTIFVRQNCADENFLGPEYQDPLFNDVIIWDDWQEWLLMKNLDDDTLALSTAANAETHHGRWYNYEVVDDFLDKRIDE